MKKRMWHFINLATAWFIVIIGVVFLVSPIPIGIFFIALGLSLLIYTSDAVTEKVRHFRTKRKNFNEQLIWVEQKLGHRIKFVSDAMSKTRPFTGEGK